VRKGKYKGQRGRQYRAIFRGIGYEV